MWRETIRVAVMYLLQHLFNNWFRDLELDKMAAGAVSLSVVMVILILGLWKLGGGRNEKKIMESVIVSVCIFLVNVPGRIYLCRLFYGKWGAFRFAGANVWQEGRICKMESASDRTDFSLMDRSTFGYAGIFCDVLELRKITAGNFAWTIAVCSTRGVGICKTSVSFPQEFVLLYVILMMMPFQVLMLSNYLVLDKLHLLDTLWALILPSMFSTFPGFYYVQFFSGYSK